MCQSVTFHHASSCVRPNNQNKLQLVQNYMNLPATASRNLPDLDHHSLHIRFSTHLHPFWCVLRAQNNGSDRKSIVKRWQHYQLYPTPVSAPDQHLNRSRVHIAAMLVSCWVLRWGKLKWLYRYMQWHSASGLLCVSINQSISVCICAINRMIGKTKLDIMTFICSIDLGNHVFIKNVLQNQGCLY